MKKIIYFFLIFATPFLLFGASPPWVAAQSLVKSALEADSCVTVSDLTTTKTIPIFVCKSDKAKALATLLSNSTLPTNRRISFKIYDSSQQNSEVLPSAPPTKEEMASVLQAAFSGNTHFVRIVFEGRTSLEFAPTVVQYWCDNIDDLYGNITETSERAMKEIFNFRGGFLSSISTHTKLTVPVF